jgi:ectoine hydroxylase-related dioxygenase (phytanoyl-CoA dioxygenase family)
MSRASTFDVLRSEELRLTADEYWFFRHNGFLRLREPIPSRALVSVRGVVEREIAAGTSPLRLNDQGAIKRIDRLVDRDPAVLEILRSPQLRGPLSSLLGPNVFVVLNRHNHATTNRAGDIAYRLHRDIVQWSRPIVTAIVYLDEATVATGCTHIVPGSHLAAFAGMAPDGGGGNWADDHDEYEAFHAQAVPVPMPAGGILLFEGLLFHSVGVNTTADTRLSMTFAFHSVDELDDSAQHKRLLLFGERIYKGNDLDYR